MQYSTTAGIRYGTAEKQLPRIKYGALASAVLVAGALSIGNQLLFHHNGADPQTKVVQTVSRTKPSLTVVTKPSSSANSNPSTATLSTPSSSTPATHSSGGSQSTPALPTRVQPPALSTPSASPSAPVQGGMGGGAITDPTPTPGSSSSGGTGSGTVIDPLLQTVQGTADTVVNALP